MVNLRFPALGGISRASVTEASQGGWPRTRVRTRGSALPLVYYSVPALAEMASCS